MKEKRIKKWKRSMDVTQAAQYLHDMAAEGLILDEVGYWVYYFREEEPKDLRYRLRSLEHAPSGEELAALAAEGWQVAGHWELEYVFVTEQSDAPPLFPQEEETDWRSSYRRRRWGLCLLAAAFVWDFIIWLILMKRLFC